MSFGFSPSDIVTLITLTTKTYRGWKSACGDYADITVQLDSLLILLDRIETEAKKPQSSIVRSTRDRNDLRDILSSCDATIRELNSIITKFHTLGRSKSRERNWQRLRFGFKNLDNLRSKLHEHKTTLSAYLGTVGLSTLAKIEKDIGAIPEHMQRTIDGLAAEIRAGRRESSIMTTYDDDEKEVWRQFRRELIGDGMRSSIIHKYKPHIRKHLRKLADQGLLEEWSEQGDRRSSLTSRSKTRETRASSAGPSNARGQSGRVGFRDATDIFQEFMRLSNHDANEDGRDEYQSKHKSGTQYRRSAEPKHADKTTDAQKSKLSYSDEESKGPAKAATAAQHSTARPTRHEDSPLDSTGPTKNVDDNLATESKPMERSVSEPGPSGSATTNALVPFDPKASDDDESRLQATCETDSEEEHLDVPTPPTLLLPVHDSVNMVHVNEQTSPTQNRSVDEEIEATKARLAELSIERDPPDVSGLTEQKDSKANAKFKTLNEWLDKTETPLDNGKLEVPNVTSPAASGYEPQLHRDRLTSTRTISEPSIAGSRFSATSYRRPRRARAPRSSISSSSRTSAARTGSEQRVAQAAQAALIAGAVEAFRSRKEPGDWTGEKGRRIATAALGAGGIDALLARSPGDKSRRHLAEAVLGGLAAGHIRTRANNSGVK